MKTDITFNPQKIGYVLSQFIHRYHVIVFVLIVIGGLSAATFTLYQTVVDSQSAGTPASGTAFDKKTIEKIKGLRGASDASTPLTLPSGRTNPFEE